MLQLNYNVICKTSQIKFNVQNVSIDKTYQKVTTPQKSAYFTTQVKCYIIGLRKVVKFMALKNLASWNTKKSAKAPSSACGSACGASDEKKAHAACGSACGAGDNK
jgi:hypothetical protein